MDHTPTHLEIVRDAVADYIHANRSRLRSQAALARELGYERQSLDSVLSGRYASRPIARLLAPLGIPICTTCGRAACPGCGGNGAGEESQK